ncbi:sensor histidine kinase [Glaciibacter superstes]|uniref:sensor histidine kinase n=1 Tax=Glaciibacter superstes TaxID=501023 RepID=UPI0003B582A2|nr:sensor histidine kinase [Glaciibacter superstes]
MTVTRWWDVAFAGAIAIMAVVTVVTWAPSEASRVAALATLAAIGVCYVAFGRRGLDEERASVAFRVVLIVGCGVGTFFSPNVATLQAIAFPFLWALTESVVACIVLSGLLATSIGLGFAIQQGGTPDAIMQAIMIAGLSFAFAVALGLWITKIAEKGDRHRVLLEELTAAQGELAALHRDAGSAAERERLAREIHDTIAQNLTSAVMLAQRARRELDALGADTGAVEDTVEMIESTAREALTDARSLVASMSPVRSAASGGAESSLAETVGRLAVRFERETGIQVDSRVFVAGFDRELEVVLLRCAQEGLANVRKHSRASVASVVIVRDGDDVILEVRDNGRGLGSYAPETESGFGLAGMRDRVDLVGGRLDVSGGPDGGAVLRVSVPSGDLMDESALADTDVPANDRTAR